MQYANIVKQSLLQLKQPKMANFQVADTKVKLIYQQNMSKMCTLKILLIQKNFKETYRQYNNTLAFTSMGLRKNGNSETILLICALRARAKACIYRFKNSSFNSIRYTRILRNLMEFS